MPHKFWPDVVRMGLLALGYCAAAELGSMQSLADGDVARLWVPSGIALAALVLYGARLWPGVALGAFCATYSSGSGSWVSLTIAMGHTLEPLVATWLLRAPRLGFQHTLRRFRDYALLLLVGAVGTPIIGTFLVSAVLSTTGPASSWNHFATRPGTCWMGKALGVVVVAPLLLLLHDARGKRSQVKLEGVLLLLAVSLWGQIVFGGWFAATMAPYAKGFTLFPFIALVAIRLGQGGAALAALIVTSQALWGASRGIGYFAQDIAETGLLNLGLYSGVLSVTGMLLATVLAELRQANVQGRMTREMLQLVIDTIPHCVFWKDRTSRYVGCNERFARLLGLSRVEDIVGKTDYELTKPELAELYRRDDAEVLASGKGKYNYLETATTPDGRPIALETSKVPLYGSGHAIMGVLGIFQDVSQRKRREEMLRLAARVFESVQEGIMITDLNGNIESVNPAFTEITGYEAAEVVGKNPRVLKSDTHDSAFFREIFTAVRRSGHWRGEVVNRHKSGETYTSWQTISAITDDEGRVVNYIGVLSDISHIKVSQQKLQHLAHHDPLTGLPNRLLLRDRLEHAIQRATRSGTQVAVVFLDLDHFKHVNDSLGHTVGDDLLQAVAGRLQAAVRRDDTLARLGGDEFTVLMEGLNHGSSAAHLAEKLIQAVSQPFLIQGHELFLGASIGISIYPQDAQSAEALLQNADAAMYRAKDMGREAFCFYAKDMTTAAFQRVTLEGELRHALQRGELVLYYQPQVDLASGHVAGVEALVRWAHPRRGLVLPADFIPVAEESGLIFSLGEWVLRAACAQGRAWLDAGVDFGCLAVNIAGRQILRGSLIDTVRQVLNETGLPPQRLNLEISETSIMTQTKRTLDPLMAIRDLGVALAIDDFGTGHSSLAYLKQLPINKLKLDKAFVDDLPEGENDAAIARAVIALGRSLEFEVIAEGVETLAQRDFLRAEGCDQAQGFLYSPPLTAEALARFVGQRFRHAAAESA